MSHLFNASSSFRGRNVSILGCASYIHFFHFNFHKLSPGDFDKACHLHKVIHKFILILCISSLCSVCSCRVCVHVYHQTMLVVVAELVDSFLDE